MLVPAAVLLSVLGHLVAVEPDVQDIGLRWHESSDSDSIRTSIASSSTLFEAHQRAGQVAYPAELPFGVEDPPFNLTLGSTITASRTHDFDSHRLPVGAGAVGSTAMSSGPPSARPSHGCQLALDGISMTGFKVTATSTSTSSLVIGGAKPSLSVSGTGGSVTAMNQHTGLTSPAALVLLPFVYWGLIALLA